MSTSSAQPVLVTGFEPFAGDVENPSELVAKALDGQEISGRRVVAEILPCAFARAPGALRAAVERHNPAVILCLGQAGGRTGITIERVAINLSDSPIPDNAGARPIDEPVNLTGPAAWWATLPVKAAARAIILAGIEASVSQTAGTFVCNQVFYSLMEMLSQKPGVLGGFVHLPFLPSQSERQNRGVPWMDLGQMVRGVEIVIATTLAEPPGDLLAGGATH